MKDNRNLKSYLVLVAIALVPILLGVSSCPPPIPDEPTEFDANYRLVFPQTATAPVIDGLIQVSGTPDPGWNNGFRYEFGIGGGSVPEAVMHGVADENNFYIYVEIEDNTFDLWDVLVLGINPTSTNTGYRRIHIFPCPTGASGCPANGSGLSPTVQYWTGTPDSGQCLGGSLNQPTFNWTSASASSIDAKAATAFGKWSVEVKIPRAAPFNLPSANYFGFYVNVAKVYTVGSSQSAAQFTWPPGSNRIIGCVADDIVSEIESGTPRPEQWGNATLSTAIGNGVHISGVKTNHGPSTISWNQSNTFYARANNNTLVSGTLQAANDIRATFTWANFGLPAYSDFTNVPAPGNPTAAANVPATGSLEYSTGQWTVPSGQQQFYQNNPHWCVKAKLSSNNANTVFFHEEKMVNMQFTQTSSPFQRSAVIGTEGYELIKDQRVHEFQITEHFYNVDPKLKWQSTVKGPASLKKDEKTRTYTLSIAPKKKATLNLEVSVPLERIPSEKVAIRPGTGGKDLPLMTLPVKRGQLITLIAKGQIQFRREGGAKALVGPGGRDIRYLKDVLTGLNESSDKQYLLKPVSSPQTAIGALIGSWDKFDKTSFYIGPSGTIKVPEKADTLYLAINDVVKGYEHHSGEGFVVNVIASDIKDYHILANTVVAKIQGVLDMPLGANLPTVVYRGKIKTAKVIKIKGQQFHIYEDIGAFGYMVDQIK